MLRLWRARATGKVPVRLRADTADATLRTHARRSYTCMLPIAAACAFAVFALSARIAAEPSYREIVDPATGVRFNLPSDLLARQSATRRGTNWSTVDGTINLDTLAYPEDQSLRRLYENLRAIRGRRLERDHWSEQGFALAGRDQDGSSFQVEMHRQGAQLRGYSLVYAPAAAAVAHRLLEHLRFQAFPEPGAGRGQPAATAGQGLRAASDLAANGITVEPNLRDIRTNGGVAFAPDGRYVAVGDGTQIKLWDITSGRPLRILQHSAYFEHFTFIEQGTRILSVHKDGQARIWDPLTGQMLTETPLEGFEAGEPIRSLSHHPAQHVVVVTPRSGRILVWDYQRLATRAHFAFDGARDNPRFAEGARLSGDGRTLIAAGSGMVKRFDAATAKPRASIALRTDLQVLPSGVLDDKFIVAKTADEDCDADVVLVTLTDGGPRYATLDTAPHCKRSQDGAPDEEAADDDILVVHNADKGLLFVGRRGGGASKLLALADVPADGANPALRTVDGAIEAVDPSAALAAVGSGRSLRIVRLMDGRQVGLLTGHGHSGMFPIASVDGRQMMLHHAERGIESFISWPITGGTPTLYRVRLPAGFSVRHAAPDAHLVLSDDGKGHLLVHSMLSGTQVAAFSLTDVAEINRARLSPDGDHVLIDAQLPKELGSDPNADFTPATLLVETKTGNVLHAFTPRKTETATDAGDTDSVRAFAFSADGQRLALGWISGVAEIWSVKPSQLIKRLDAGDDQTTSLTFAPDNRFLIGGSRDAGIFVWSLESGKLLRNLERAGVAGHVSTGSVGISQDSELVAAGPMQRATSSGDVGRERRVQVWDLASGTPRFLLSGHEANVNALLFTPDGRWLVSGSNDGTVRYWDRRTATLVATFAAAGDGRWVMVTNRGFFAASADAGDLLSVVRGYEATSIAQMWQSLYAPDLVRELLAGDPSGEVEAATAHADLQKVLASGPAPDVAVSPPPANSAGDLIEVEARITDRGKGVGRIEWRVNGITTAVSSGPAGAGPEYRIAQRLALDPGANIIEVIAYNASNLLASLPARATVTLSGAAEAAKPRLHVLAIGINAYHDQGWTPPGSADALAFPPLNLAVSDAKAVAAALKTAGAGQYGEVRVTEALDQNASADALEQTIARMSAEVDTRDTFVLFAAAHGTSHDGRFYLIPQDYDGGPNPDALQRRAIGQQRLQDWVANRIKAKKAILLLDTCESGALVAGYSRSRADVPASEAAIGRLHEATGRPVLTAAAEGKPAFEGYQGHGVFTWALLDALSHGDRNGDGLIELSELVAHVQDQVPTVAAKLNGRGRAAIAARGSTEGGQSAHFGSRGEDFALVRRLP